MSVGRITGALAGLLLLFGAAWVIGNMSRSTAVRQSGAPSPLPSASVERTSLAVPDLPVAVALPGLAAARRPKSVTTSSVSARTTTSPASPAPSTNQPSQSTSGQTYTRPSSGGSSGATHTSPPAHKTKPPVVGGGGG